MRTREVAAERTDDPAERLDRPTDVRLHARIREDIVEGRLEPGARLKTAVLAERYGTSTNPVREALHHLQGQGLVVIEPNRGARVRPLGEDYVRNIYEIRALIEPYLTRWFAHHATEAEIETLENAHSGIENPANDFDTHRRLNDAFHDAIYERHFNREAVELEVGQREVLDLLNRKFTIGPARRRQVAAEHRDIIEAIRHHDADRAAAAAERHVRHASQHLINRMRAAWNARPAPVRTR